MKNAKDPLKIIIIKKGDNNKETTNIRTLLSLSEDHYYEAVMIL